MLVGTLEVHAGGMPRLPARLQHTHVGHAGLEPDIQDVGDLLIIPGLLAQEFLRIELEPGIDPFVLDTPCDFVDKHLRARMGLA